MASRYPNVVVTGFERDAPDPKGRVARDPKLIVEVLSESRAAVDRGEKLDEHGFIGTLQEHALIDSRRRWCEAYRRENAALRSTLPIWGGRVELQSISA
jgi:Uma2 family endonuclease